MKQMSRLPALNHLAESRSDARREASPREPAVSPARLYMTSPRLSMTVMVGM